jgi:hypothetical protein
VQLESALDDKRTQHFDEQLGISFGLQQPPPHVSSRGREKRSRGIENVGC